MSICALVFVSGTTLVKRGYDILWYFFRKLVWPTVRKMFWDNTRTTRIVKGQNKFSKPNTFLICFCKFELSCYLRIFFILQVCWIDFGNRLWIMEKKNNNRTTGLFTNYVDKNLAFFYHVPPSVYISYLMNIDKNRYFLTIYPLVNVVYERPLGWTHFFSTKNFTTIAKQSCAIARRLQAWSPFTIWISGLALL